MSVFDRLRSTDVSSKTAGFSIGALLVLFVGVILVVKNIAGSPPAAVEVPKPRAASKSPVVNVSEAPAASRSRSGNPSTTARSKPSASAREQTAAGEDHYSVIVERNVFRPLGQGSTGAQSEGGVAPMPVPSIGKLPQLPAVTVVPIEDEFKKNIAFTGTFGTPSGMVAILENVSTKETMLVKQGESAFGCVLTGIEPKSVSLVKDGQMFTLAIGENKVPEAGGSSKPGSDQKQPQRETARSAQPGKPGQNGQPGQNGKPEQNGQPGQNGKSEKNGQPGQNGQSGGANHH